MYTVVEVRFAVFKLYDDLEHKVAPKACCKLGKVLLKPFEIQRVNLLPNQNCSKLCFVPSSKGPVLIYHMSNVVFYDQYR
jgi:hypothetical protein